MPASAAPTTRTPILPLPAMAEESTVMHVSSGLSHIAMSVPAGTLTDEHRAELLDFYGRHFGWREIESLRLPDRLTMSIGGNCYINIRERSESATYLGYEHFGLLVESPDDADRIWAGLESDGRDVHLEPLSSGDDGYRSFRFRYLLPLAVEVQFIPVSVDVQSLP
jgi:catechol 2,3-dioxygenase-like lactoylglutathione lyase family enzyme